MSSEARTLRLNSTRMQARTLHEHLVTAITEQIVSGQIAPGAALPTEPELCASFDVSRTVVREAVRVLAAKGLIEVKHGSGMRVLQPEQWHLLDPQILFGRVRQDSNAALLAEMLEVRRIIETEVAGMAAERRDAADMARLQDLLAQLEAGMSDPDLYTRLDYEFHEAILAAARNRLLAETLRPLAKVIREARLITNRGARSLVPSQLGHAEICEAILAGDAVAARDAMRRHIQQFERDIRKGVGAE